MFGLVKWIEFFLEPGNTLVLLIAAGVALQWTRWRRIGLYLTTASAGMLLLLLVFPIGYWMLKPLEDRYPRPAWPAHVDGIVVLGGGMDPVVYEKRNAPAEDVVEGRLVAAAELARRYPNARIVFSGGSEAPEYLPPEAEAARLAFAQLGIPEDRITYEDRSRNTWENLAFSQRLVRPKPGEVWLLATSASHLPRAMLIAGGLGWHLVAWPTDYKTTNEDRGFVSGLDLANNLQSVDTGLHEWLGILAYGFSNK
jgi:uncharacterized SAM-binding protein YcdF (DUF218 family)